MDCGACSSVWGWIFPVVCIAVILLMCFSVFRGTSCFPWRRNERKTDEIEELKKEIAELKELVKESKEKR